MKEQPHEMYARELYARLEEKYANNIPNVSLSIEGKGVHWHCTASQKENFCIIHCFSYFGEDREYLVYFERIKQRITSGRTHSLEDAVAAVDKWLNDVNLDELYDQFGFVDKRKRAFKLLEKQVIQFYPQLAECSIQELRNHDDFYYLWFYTKERMCHFEYWGRNELPDCFFDWDNCNLLKVQNGNMEQLSLAMKRWLCDFAMPSTMEKEFSWLSFGKLGYYYEQGRSIEGEFVVSWDYIEEFFQGFKFPWIPEALSFINQLRQQGYDHTLRAGQSMTTFAVSRSRRYGLRPEQPSISFNFTKKGLQMTVHNIDGTKTFSIPVIALNEEIDTELKRLEAKEID